MYFIELIIKKFFNKKNKLIKQQNLQQDEQRCDHIFMPIDSTGEILACSKCGAIVKRKDLKKYKKQD